MVSTSHNRSNPLRPKRRSFKRSTSLIPASLPTMTNTSAPITTETMIPNPHESSKPLQSLHLNHCVKLNAHNYSAWHFQLTHILFGYSLLGFLDGSESPPPKNLVDTNNTEKPNPAYLTWLKQDGLIVGALMGTITSALQPLIVRAKTAKEAWDILDNTYANPSRAHILQLKDKFDSIVKTTDQTISDYMNSIKVCVDQLALMGKIIDPEDVIARVLKGLDDAVYEPKLPP